MFMYVVLPLFLAIFGGLNYYIGRRGWQWVSAMAPVGVPQWAYWLTYWLLALSFVWGRFTSEWLPTPVAGVVAALGGYWMAALIYVLPLLLLIDLFRLLNRWFRLVPARMIPDVNLVKVTGAGVCLLYVGLMIFGTWNARTPVVTEYAVSIPKTAGAHNNLHVVLVSDTHLGAILGNSRIKEMVAMVNRLEPDLILVAGDIIDDDFRPFLEQDMASELVKMKARLGTYGVLGNHDAGSEQLAEFRAHLKRGGIDLLVDEWVKVDDSFYVAGRNDSSQRRHSGAKPLGQVLTGVDPKLPILLMDHQPGRLDESVAAGIDLQVSGHTHRGQLFPGSLITRRIYEVDWGYLKKEATQFVVSLGYGTWGPPIRIGNRPEVVSIRVSFGK